MAKWMKRLIPCSLAAVLAAMALCGCKEATHPVVTIEMADGGIIKMELYPEIAPETVNNFVYLINQGFYDGLTFHRVEKGFVVQSGDPTASGSGHPGYSIKGEFQANGVKNDLSHVRGTLSMARASYSYDTAGSQFFIVLEDSLFLDRQYAGFGTVTEGMDVVDKIKVGDVMKKVTVDTFGVTYPEPKKLDRLF